ncbi:hypothetical protein D3C78_1426680 [compost metagenome]
MQAVSQFNDNDTDVLSHSDKHFPIVFILLFFFGLKFDSLKLCQSIYKQCTVIPELALNLLQ